MNKNKYETPYARTKAWREGNKEKHKAQWVRYYQKNSEKIKELKREKYQLNKSRI